MKEDKVRFREAFLLGNPEFLASASNQVQAFREQFQLACPLQQRKNQLDLKQFKDSTFEEKLFGLQKNWSNTRADSDQFEHRYEHNKKTRILDEGTLAQFFQAFRYYTNVPKGEDMVKILDRLFDDNFDEKLFEKYLIPKQIANKKAQPDRYIDRNQVNSVIKLIKLKKQYTAQGISGVLFTKESSLQLRKCLKEFVDQKEEDHLLNIVAPYALDWTAYRVQKELRNISTCIVIMEKHVPLVNDKLSLILETHIASEIGTLVVTGVNSLDQQNLTNLRQKVKRIVLISTSATADDDVFEDTLSDEHVTLDFAQFEHLQMRLDGRTLPLKIVEEQFQSVQSRAELFNLKSPIVVKSDLYVPEQRLNIYRTLIDDQQKKITNEQLKDRMQNRVTVIIGPNCQGKSNDLLQIANHLNEGDAICLFFNAQIIAAHCAKHNEVLEASVPLNGWDIFIKLLQITPSSDVIKDIVVQHLA
ncbi:uncharacterized protein LOC126578100 isoform X2 [Anopheles aquasalis]|uniref:uncharacterized protein LOC126578100 isoform X2 n=1 Tax=Anopheles aquasalis TaxID=42839 RepID=UPI00215B5E39|nr:uncharacterized protein LOC126578100 isoform X2 [Anopheles aquasalis]